MEAAVNSASVPELDLKVIADRDASLMLGNSPKIEGFWTVHEQSPSFDSPRRFEDLVTWQRARTLTNLVYARCTEQSFIRDFPLMSQMRRAAVSIMSNIAEGNERDG